MTTTYETSQTVDCDPRLVVISNVIDDGHDEPTRPPVTAFESPFQQRTLHEVGASVRRIARQEGSNIDSLLFVVLDQRSTTDKTALLVQINGGDGEDFDVESLRASFDVVNYTLNSLNVGVTSFVEQQDLARANLLMHLGASEKPRGGPAPRRKLGR